MNEQPSNGGSQQQAGWASLPWREGPPKRRGLWAVEWVNGEVGVYDVQKLGRQWCADGGPQPMGRWIPCEDYNVRRSVGPLVKRDGAWFVETTPNDASERQAGKERGS